MNFSIKNITYIFFLFFSIKINAQTESKISALKISYANDFFTGTDQYFTQGIRIEFISPVFKKSPVVVLSFLPKKENLIYHSVAIQQDGFTPTSIRYDSILQGDRPFCGSLFFTNSEYIFSENKKRIYHTQLDIGAIGPLALGYEEQTAIHRAIHDELPKGWKNQIQNDLILNYKIAIQEILVEKKLFDFSALYEARIGTIYADAAFAGNIRFGLREKSYTGIAVAKQNKLQIYGSVKGGIKGVAYNATMQGGIFNRKSIYTLKSNEINRFVTSAQWAIVTSYKNLQVEYCRTYISKEFKKGMPHVWGEISLMLGF